MVLPQYSSPRSTVTSTIRVDGEITAGATNFMVNGVSAGSLRPGDMFNFNDTNNSNHKKTYQVTRVLDSTNYLAGNQPTDSSHRIYYVTPSVEKTVTTNMTLTYTNPIFRVVQSSDVISYSLNTNNLYEFSLNLEEVQV